MLIEREGNFFVGIWNALVLTVGALLIFIVVLNLYRWMAAPPAPVEEAQCLILLPPEVSQEPDYRVGRGKECE